MSATAPADAAAPELQTWLLEMLSHHVDHVLEASATPTPQSLTSTLESLKLACAAHLDPATLSLHVLAGVTDSLRRHAGFAIVGPDPQALWVAHLGDTKPRRASGAHSDPPAPQIRILSAPQPPREVVVLAQPATLHLSHQGTLDLMLCAMRRGGSTVRYQGSSIWPARVLKALCMDLPVILIMPQGTYSRADMAITVRCLTSGHYQFCRFDPDELLVAVQAEELLAYPEGDLPTDLVVLPPGISIAAIQQAVKDMGPAGGSRVRVSI